MTSLLSENDEDKMNKFMSEFYEEHIFNRIFFLYEAYAKEFESKMNSILGEFFSIKSTDPNYSGELWAKVMELYESGELIDETCIIDDPT